MLPSLHNLRIDGIEDDTGVMTKKMKREAEAAAKQEAERAAKAERNARALAQRNKERRERIIAEKRAKEEELERRRAAEAEEEKRRKHSVIFDEFPEGKVFTLDGLTERLRLPSLIQDTFGVSNWVFSAETSVTGIRLNGSSTLGSESINALGVVSVLGSRFANNDGTGNCGSYNCFEKSVRIEGDDVVSKGLRALISALQNMDSFMMPSKVSVRAPKKSNRETYSADHTRLGRDELALTLHMAATQIGPPILAALPVDVLGKDSIIAINDYAYVTESDWTDLERLLDRLRYTHTTPDSLDAAVNSISKATVALMRRVAANGIVLTDVKLTNMIARRQGWSNNYEVRMIDFGAYFTADVNMHAAQTGEVTPEECIFFINGLLLANYVLTFRGRDPWNHKHVFKQLVKEVSGTWKHMEKKGMANGFCALIARDEVYPREDSLLDLTNLLMVPKDDFFTALRNVFYLVLENYGHDDVLQQYQSKAPEGVNPSYISRLVDRIEALYK
jgi:hypothetical protein